MRESASSASDSQLKWVCSINAAAGQSLSFWQKLAQTAQGRFESFRGLDEFRRWAGSQDMSQGHRWLVALETGPDKLGIDKSGVMDALSWLKRHPRLHFGFVVILASETEVQQRQEFIRAGGWLVTQQADEPLMQQILHGVGEASAEAAELAHLEQLFSSELLERITECRQALASLDRENAARMYRAFHTIKGSSQTLQYPGLARLLHHAESFLEAIRISGDFEDPRSRELLGACLEYLERQHSLLQKRELLDEDPQNLYEELARQGARDTHTLASAKDQSPGRGGAPSGAASMRVGATLKRQARDELARVAGHVNGILALNRAMREILVDLKTEFHEESFPDQLDQMAKDMALEASGALEALSSLQSVPIGGLKGFLERTVSETARRLGKTARFEMRGDLDIPLDPRVFSTLKRVCMHLARNAVDHGVEMPQARKAGGKAEAGQVILTAEGNAGGVIKVRFEDDGAGVHVADLRDFFQSKGGAAASALEKLSEKQLLQLIFSDSFSSRLAVSEISGRGIGLSDVRQQVLELGGNIEVDSEEGKGARFTIVLPRMATK